MANTENPARAVLLLALAGSLAAGCSAPPAHRPAAINHAAFIKLKNPGDAEALLRDADAALPRIHGVRYYHAGRKLDTGRPNVIGDYDLGFAAGFDSPEAYRLYLDDPRHTDLVKAWQDRLEWIHIYDVQDTTP